MISEVHYFTLIGYLNIHHLVFLEKIFNIGRTVGFQRLRTRKLDQDDQYFISEQKFTKADFIFGRIPHHFDSLFGMPCLLDKQIDQIILDCR